MKNVILCLLLFSFISAGHSQILLNEAKVDSRQELMKIDPNSNTLVLHLKENTSGEFLKNPLHFLKNNFDIKKLISENTSQKYDEYIVNLVNRKGYLEACFSKDGDLKYSVQKFKNIRLPELTRLQVVEKYGKVPIVASKYYASSKGWEITKAYFKVKVVDGKKIRRMRIDRDQSGIASK